MRGHGLAGLVLLPAAILAVALSDVVWPALRRVMATVAGWRPVVRAHAWVGRLPPGVALPLFLVPEAFSRLGWVVSAWLLLHGQGWRALAVYVASKLLAGTLALWICSASLPALLRIRAFAATYGAIKRAQQSGLHWLRRGGGGRFGAVRDAVRARRVRAGSSAVVPASATPSAPADPSRTG